VDAQTLGAVMGWSLSADRYRELLPAYRKAMRQAHINTVERAAMFAAQLGHESVGLRYQAEIWGPTAAQRSYDGRMGNRPGTDDWSRYRGHGWIQVTGRNNHTACSHWAHEQGITDDPLLFVREPQLLGSDEYCWVGPVWYWTTQRPLNALSDARDLEGATRAINGGLNGLADRRARYQKALQMGDRLLLQEGAAHVREKVLDYPRDQVQQDTIYNCGPASVQTIVRARTRELVTEAQLGRELGTHRGGTDWIGQFPRVLDAHLPGAEYQIVEMPNDPPTSAQRDTLWRNLTASIDAGYGAVANIVAPPSNYPRAVAPSTISPAYSGGTVYHYVAVMGYSEAGGRRYWIADSGFWPYGYWISHDQLATLIPPKGYAYSTAQGKDWLAMATEDDLRRIVRQELAPVVHDVKRIAVQMGLDADDAGYALVPGWVQGGHRSLYDLISAIGKHTGVPRTADTLADGEPKNARNPKLGRGLA